MRRKTNMPKTARAATPAIDAPAITPTGGLCFAIDAAWGAGEGVNVRLVEVGVVDAPRVALPAAAALAKQKRSRRRLPA